MISLNNFILSLSLVFFSTASFSIKTSFISYLLLALYIVFFTGIKSSLSEFNNKFLIFSVVFLSLCGFTLFLGDEIRYLYFIKLVLLYPYFFIVSNLILLNRINAKELDSCVQVYVVVHAITFSIQLIGYSFFDYYVDFNNMIRDEVVNTAFMSRDMKDMFIAIRATGFFSEPSFYAMTIFPEILYLFYRRKRRLIFFVGLLTVILSFSAAAFVVLILWLSVQIIFEKGFNLTKVFIIFIMCCVVFTMGAFFIKRTTDSSDYDALSARLRIISEIEKRSTLSNIFGDGFFLNEFEGNGVTGITAAGIRDSGTLLSTFYSVGLLGLVSILYLIYLTIRSFKFFIIFMIVMLFKYNILLSSFWVFLILFIIPLIKGYDFNFLNKRMSDER